MVDRFNPSIRRPNKNQFKPKTVLSTNNLFFVLIIIGGGSQMPEYQLGNPYSVLLNYVYSVSVVHHRNASVVTHRYVNMRNGHRICGVGRNSGFHSHDVVATINDAFVEQFK